jgi:peptidoglycan/LPS O-acetylase OafA/YrhL
MRALEQRPGPGAAVLARSGPVWRPARRGDLDALRALVVVGLVFFHSAVIFGAGEFPVKAPVEHRLATVLVAFGATWGMPLLFVISGMGIWYSLGSRGVAGFARERLRRLGVPLLVGLLTLVPLQVWLGRRRAGDAIGAADLYTRFWDVRPSLSFPFLLRAAPDGGRFETGHLWFLVCLLGFSLVLLPGMAALRGPRGRRLVEGVAGWLDRPGGLLLPVLPLAAVEVALGSEVGHGGWNDASYALLLLYGFLAAADPRVGRAMRRRWRPALALGGLLFLAAGALYAATGGAGDPLSGMDPPAMAFRLLKSAAGWSWVVAILGLADSRTAAAPTIPAAPGRPGLGRRLGAAASDVVLAFYLLHEPVVVAVAYVALSWRLAAGVQYLLISGMSLVITVLLCGLVRRGRVTRFLFGLKPGEEPSRP